MSFFLPGKSRCFLCGNAIATRAEAGRVPYAAPDDVGDDAKYGRSFVHRRCWDSWPNRARWAQSAARLLRRASDRIVSDEETTFVLEGARTGSAMLVDTGLLIEAEMSTAEMGVLRDTLLGGEGGELAVGAYRWQVTTTADAMTIESWQDGELVERWSLTEADRQRWTRVLSAAVR